MGLSVVHDDDVADAELGHETSANPTYESLAVGRLEERAERQPAIETHGTDHRQVDAPVRRPWLDQLITATYPGVRPHHRRVCAGFVEEN
jgi:hypothetical protein